MQKDFEKIITDGVFAPSGENCQPWKFSIKGNKINIFNIPERDQSLYNYQQKGSCVAHGALIENMIVSSSQYGYMLNLDFFPRIDDPNLVATLTLDKAATRNE